MPPAASEPLPAWSVRTLLCQLKSAKIGTGDVQSAIASAEFRLNERSFTTLIVSCRRYGHWRKALEIFEVMKTLGMATDMKPNFYTYSSLISVCSSAGACTQGIKILKEMRNAAMRNPKEKPDIEVFEALISACHRRCRYLDVVYLHDAMVDDGILVTKRILLFALEACGEIGLWERAFKILDQLWETKAGIPHDLYRHLLSCCAEQRDLRYATEVFLAMQMAGLVPDPLACHHMVRAAVAASRPGMCLDLLRSMDDAGVIISIPTYKSVMGLLDRCKLNDMVETLVGIMEAQKARQVERASAAALDT